MKKKVQCILLNTKTTGALRQTTNGLGGEPVLSLGRWGNEKHLYFVSDELIKNNDWFIFEGTLYRATENTNEKSVWSDTFRPGLFSVNQPELKKVVATTNPELWSNTRNKHGMAPYNSHIMTNIPKIGDDFISAYIKAYNEGSPINTVTVEYWDWFENGYDGTIVNKHVKTHSDGTVIISPSKEDLNPNNLKVGEKYWIKYLPCDSMWEPIIVTRFTDQGYAWGKGPKHNGIIAQDLYDIIAFDALVPKVEKMYTRDDMINSIKEYNNYYTSTQSPVETVDTWFDKNYPQS